MLILFGNFYSLREGGERRRAENPAVQARPKRRAAEVAGGGGARLGGVKRSRPVRSMAVPGRRNGVMGDDDDEDEVLFDDGDVMADLDLEPVPLHLRALVEAAETGNLDALRVALDNHNGSIDEPVEDGDTVLHLSCLYGYFPCVQLLLERGASLESRDEEGAIPLHDACAGGFSEIVQYMLNFAGRSEVVKRMINATDTEGDTPLHHAARGEHLDVVRLLLAAGASPKKTNVYGKIPAELADLDTEVRSILTAAASSEDAVQ